MPQLNLPGLCFPLPIHRDSQVTPPIISSSTLVLLAHTRPPLLLVPHRTGQLGLSLLQFVALHLFLLRLERVLNLRDNWLIVRASYTPCNEYLCSSHPVPRTTTWHHSNGGLTERADAEPAPQAVAVPQFLRGDIGNCGETL